MAFTYAEMTYIYADMNLLIYFVSSKVKVTSYVEVVCHQKYIRVSSLPFRNNVQDANQIDLYYYNLIPIPNPMLTLA